MRIENFLDNLKHRREYENQIAHVQRIPAREAIFGDLERPLPELLADCLIRNGVTSYYSHQAHAINAIRRGYNTVVATSTASGKTLCYNVPVLDSILSQPRTRALYLFPTKALAQDQIRSIRELISENLPHISGKINTFDGDTPQYLRAQIKKSSQIILTNPDMLHLGILPNHGSWATFFRNLRYVVIDEAHVYRGVFGSHVSNVLRRLRRICNQYGSKPIFIATSATIANPQDHIERLTGETAVVIDEDGSPHGSKDFVFWNPPFVDTANAIRRSANSEATFLFSELVANSIRTITFTRTRRQAELIYLYTRENFPRERPDLVDRIKPYRAGYLPEQRREIERDLFGGQLLGVTATNALELGVDIGDLDATVLTGYPGTIASTWQQAGRSGRGRGHSLSFLIGQDNPLDQYFMRYPHEFFEKSNENALIDPENPQILSEHLLCAAYELPMDEADASYFGSTWREITDAMIRAKLLSLRNRRLFPATGVDYPAQKVNIRSTSSDNFVLLDASNNNRLMETIDSAVAFFQIHPGAIYLHQGDSYEVQDLDLQNRRAYAVQTDGTFYTQTKETTDLRILQTFGKVQSGGVEACLGEVEVTTQVLGYKKKRQFTDEVIGEVALELPPISFRTVSLWFDLPRDTIRNLITASLDVAGGLHATEHAMIGMLPLFAMCDRQDIGGLSTPYHPDTGKAQVFVYDAHPGGIGISKKGFEMLESLWNATLRAIKACPCQEGCPSCIQSPKCGNNNEPLDKKAAMMILQDLLSAQPP